MFDHLYTLAEGQCVYQGSIQQLVPFLGSLGLVCPSYHNPASFCKIIYIVVVKKQKIFMYMPIIIYLKYLLVIEVSCGEYGDNVKKLVDAIKNGTYDIQNNKPFPIPEVFNNTVEKNPQNGIIK